MKKRLLLAFGAAVMLSSCGTVAQLGPSSEGSQFQDGIYGKAPSFRSKEEKNSTAAEAQALAEKTKGSTIYLFGDKKDTVYVPKDMAARISFTSELGTTVTVSEYDWRYDSPWSYYTPYSIGSSWYWSRHYDPWYRSAWAYSPWSWYGGWYGNWYGGWYDPWYSWNDPWFYGGYWGGLYDPWHYYHAGWYGGYWGPYYAGWYGGWDPFWHYGHHHHHHHLHHPGVQHVDIYRGGRYQTESGKVFNSRTSLRGGLGTSSSTRRDLSSSESRTTNRGTTGSTRVTRTVSKQSSATAAPSRVQSTGRATPTRTGTTVRTALGSSQPKSSEGGTAVQTTRSNYRRPVSSGVSSGSASSSTGRSNASATRSGSTYERSSSQGSSSNYNRSSSSSSYNRSSSGGFSSGSAGRSSGGFSGGGSFSGGGGASRSGGGGGARR